MHNDPEGVKLWNRLRMSWQEAHQSALHERLRITRKQIDCAAGNGPDPTIEEIQEVERLEALATHLSIEMDNFVKNRLG